MLPYLDEPDCKVLPQPTEVIKNGVKTITEYKRNDDDKLVKVIIVVRDLVFEIYSSLYFSSKNAVSHKPGTL